MKNLLNNLLNWVLKKGSSETKKEQAWEEKEQAGSKKDQVKGTKLVQKRSKLSEKDQVKGTKLSEKEQAGSKKEQAEQKGNKLGEKGTSLEMNPCVMGSEAREGMGSEVMSVKGSEAMSANHALITQLSRNNHPISLRAIRYAAVLFMVLMVGVGQVWGAWSTAEKPTSTLTCSASASTGITKSYNFHSDATNSDTIVFSAYDAYNASVTWGTKTSNDITNTSKSWNPIIYRSASNNASATTSVYSGGGQMLTKFRTTRKVRFLVTNCTGAMISGLVGSSYSLTLNAYLYSGGTISSTAAVTGSTITNTSIASASISGLSAENTYVIEIAGGADNNDQHLAEVAFIYPHAAGGVTNPSFSPATGNSLVKSTGTVTLTSSGNTVYYKWSQTNNLYASGDGSTLAGAADGSGSSPVNATAPSTAGTWYLYAVAKNGGDYSNVVKATYTITNPTHTLTWNLDGGTATGGTAAGAVAEGATLTAPTVTKVGYDFAGWSPAVPATMPAADATYTASWTKVYASGTYTFENNAALGTLPNKLTMTNGSDVAVAAGSRIDNLFFSAMTIRYESGTYSGSGDDFKGWKIKTDAATIKFFVENDCDVTIGVGNLTSGATITYTNQSGTVKENQSLTAKQDNTYSVKGGTMVTFKTSGGSTVTLKKIQIGSSCTAPTAVYVTQTAGSADMIAGESFTLSAATSTGVEEGATYQWYRNSTEVGTNSPTFTVPSCTKVDAGTYWCKITNPCSSDAHTTNVTGFGIKVWQVLLCESSTWNSYDLTSTGTKTGRMSRQLAPGTYYIKLTHNNGVDFGVNTGATISEISATTPSPWTLYGSQNNIKLTVTTAGEYTFDVNYTSADNPTLSVTYPPSTISSCDKIYFCPTQNSIATGSAKFSIYFYNATTNAWANCYLVSGTEYADDAKYVAFAPSTATGWTGMIVVRDNEYASSFSDIWNQSQDITYNGYNYIVGAGWSDGKFTNNLNSFYSSTTPAMSAASYATTVDGTTNASTNLTGATISYASDDPSVATVNSSGVITGVAAGETTITASVGSCTVGTATVTVSKNTPTAYTVSGTTTICSGSTATITLSGSEDGASYQLKKGGVAEGVAKAGTGSSLTWTVSAAGTYTVSAVETAKYLGGDMTDDAVITVNTPVTISWNNAPANGTVGGSMTASVTTNYSDGVAYSVQSATPAGCVTVGASTGVISYVAAGTATIRATVTGAGDYCSSAYVDQAITVTAAATCTGDPTALVSGELYAIDEMVSNCSATEISSTTSGGTGIFQYGLSSNGKFYVVGTTNGDNSTTGTVEMKKQGASTITVKDETFTYIAWFKGSGSTSCRSIKFVTPSAGTLIIYGKVSSGDGKGNIELKQGSNSAVDVMPKSKNASDTVHVNITAGATCYIWADGSSAALYGLKFVESACTTPAAPTAFANTAVTSTTATFSITDDADAASYDLYYASGSPSTPIAGTAATENVTTKTPTITGLTASTTYKIWVRAVCDASHKSDWVALGTTSFTTSAAEPTALVTWQMKVDQAAWALKSGTTEDGTNITSIASTADEPGSTSTGITGTTGKVVMASDESNVDKAASFTFTVNSAKKVVPEKVTCKVLNVSSGDRTYKAQLSDNNGHVYYSTNTVSVTTENVLTDATFNFASSLVLTGNVTLKVYAWKTSGSPTQFRMGEYVKLFGEVQSAADYTVTHTMSNVAKSSGATSVKEGNNYTATYAGAGGYALPSTITVTIGGDTKTVDTDYTWNQGTGVVTIPGNKVTGNIVITVTGVAPAPTYSVTHSLTNVTATSGATGAGAATEGVAYDAVFAANTGFVLPSTITVTIDGSPATVGTGYTWNATTGAFQVPAEQVTGAIVITIAGETAPATKDIYYGQVAIADGALVREITNGTIQFFTNIGGTVANNTEISLSSTPSTGGIYYNSNNLTDAELSKSSNWGTSSGSNRYVRGLKFANGATYTLALGAKVASTITFYGWCGSSSKTMTVGDEEFTSSSTKNTFAKHEFIKTGGFTGNVTISQDGDFYGIIVVTIQTADACTTPVIPTLSNQTVCPGSDIEAWNATQTAVLADGETASYSWKKKGNDTEIEDEATLDLGAATESMSGTYVVTVTVSKAGKASATATKEVTLTVTPATETPSVTASKATVYPGNSVTLTATCGSSGTITWAWYNCNSDGTGESAIGGATSNSYAIASAPAAGNHYYKVKATGDGTNACGTAEYVYTLTVSEASGTCNMMTIFDGATMSSAPASTSGTESTSGATWTAVGTATEMSSTVSMEYSGKTYTKGWKFTGGATTSSSRYIQIVIPTGYTGDLVMNGFIGSTSRSVFVATSPTGTLNTSIAYWSPATTNTLATASTRLTAGTYYVCATNSAFLAELSVNVCALSDCTDEKPTATATNNAVCSGTALTITASGYESDPTSIQWQKKNGDSWNNISGATNATYTVVSAAAADAGTYRVQVTKGCTRNSNEVTITIPSAPVFGDVPTSVTVMQTIALSISTVEASDAASYKWYKSANSTWDESDPEIGTSKNLIKAYADEATGSPSYYVICRATNSCGTTTSTAIAVNVTAYVEEDCATRGNEGEAQFGFDDGGCGQTSYSETACWTTNTRAKYLTYTAPEGKYLKTAKVTVAVSSGSKCGYAYSTDGGTNWTYAELTSLNSTLTEKTIDLNSLSSTIDAFRIGRNLQDGSSKDWGVTSGNFHLSKACFEYTDACTATTVTPSGTGSETHTIGSSFTEPTFTVKHGGTAFDPQPEITYTSSNEDIATVDDDGTVNFQGMAGSVTITAAYAGDATYCASEGHYTITVSCSDDEPKIVAASSVDLSGCNSSVVLNAKKQDGTAFAGGTYQWYRDGEAISGATSASYTAVQAGVYTVERTNSGCTNLSSNSATVTSERVEPEVERLVPFQYYHVDKTYTDYMKMRHLFTVKGSAAYGSTGKNFKMELSKNGAAATDVTTSNAFSVVKSADNTVDTVMIDLNKLNGKYAEDDELVLTCKAVDCEGNVSSTYKDEITIHVIDDTPTMALILNGKGSVVGGDFLEDYEPKNLQEQTGSKTWSGEWPMYTDLKTEYNVTPVNGYAPFNKLNYEPFDIIFLTDFPKASKSDAAATILDDMAALCDYRPLFSFKTHMVHKSPSKWAAKGFTTSPTENKGDGRTYLNIVCYAHPMFEDIKTGDDVYTDASDGSQLVYKMLSGAGYEKSKGMQGFEIDAAENFVTIGLTHYNASVATAAGVATWTPGDGDRMLVSSAERQANPEARMILLSLNAGAHSKLTEKGRAVVMKSLEYLIQTSGGLIEPADCSYTFDNAAGDNNWNTAGNWGPRHNAVPGAFTSARIAAPAVVDIAHAVAMEVRIVEGGSITIPAGKGLEVKSTIRHMDGSEISPTEISELTLEASTTSNGTLIFNNNTGDTKATVWAYSKGFISEGVKNYQYIGTPFNELNALYNYYGSWIYSWSYNSKKSRWGWVAVKNGGPMHAWTGYCISQESPTYYETSGTMTATGMVDIAVPAGENMVVGNSWTAPLYIKEFTDDDFENLVGNVYFFNTGVDKTGEGTTTVSATGDARWTGGTYVSIPIHASSYTGDSLISSMQGFFVKSNGSAGALHLDYDRHVRPSTNRNILSGELHAPVRRAVASTNEPTVLKIKVSGENYDDKLLLLEREDFTEGFDNGWDGDKWDGNASALYIYTTDSEGTENSVSAVPELEGTIIGFRAGEDDAYTLNFEYLNSDEPLYLYDVENNTYTQIMTGMTYRFFTTDNEKHERFIITRSNGQEVPTGVEPTSGSLDRSKAKKLLIEGKMFIMVNGMLYDATGKVVK